MTSESAKISSVGVDKHLSHVQLLATMTEIFFLELSLSVFLEDMVTHFVTLHTVLTRHNLVNTHNTSQTGVRE